MTFRELLAKIDAQDAAEDLERALGWTVICRDLEFGRITLYGYFLDPIEASRYADSLSESLGGEELEDGSPGWRCEVWPLLPVSVG